MADKIILPPKYYLSHFFEFINFVQKHYEPILDESHLDFIEAFRLLPEDAQCAYIRMVNRKGILFERKGFQKYTELSNFESSLQDLKTHGFIEPLTNAHVTEVIYFLSKAKLKKWLLDHGIEVNSQLSKDELTHLARTNVKTLLPQNISNLDQILVQGRHQAMEHLLFLYFGRIQKSLTLYTLRDLGIRQSQTLKSDFKPRFSSKHEADAEYFFCKHLDNYFDYLTPEELKYIFEKAKGFKNLISTTQNLKDNLLFNLAEYTLNTDTDLALDAFGESKHPEARERMARHLYKIDQKPRCLEILEQIQNDPRSDQELLFAEDFSARKFNKKKIGNLTEVLKNSREVTLSDFYLKRPEVGVCKLYQDLGYHADFTENYLWSSLFGVLFWDELFESENAAIHNPFERSPSDLIGVDFYIRNASAIEDVLNLFKDDKAIEVRILKNVTKNYGRLNDIFQWHEGLAETLIHFVKNSKKQNVAHILRTLSKNFETHHVGFPDLMVEKDGQIHFIEVKAEGDSLRASQLSRLRLLKEAGFEVEVLRVRWEADPNQTYVVVDVETTGGAAPFHRVTEVGAVKIKNGKIIDEFQTLINPGRTIPPFITQLTGISNEMVSTAPKFLEVAEKFYEFLDGAIFVAHNVKFDYGFIQHEFKKAGIDFTRAQLCTCAGIKKTHPGLKSYSLKNLTQHFKINLDQHHRALSDARAAAELLLVMNGKRKSTDFAEFELS
ncbi:MAG: VRR-NUC domain-containing protein [Bdellovibrio sp.]|nr:VRR-NUC domain-containing protein [Bdellovibrio sp.]